jgi:hypothetical protein
MSEGTTNPKDRTTSSNGSTALEPARCGAKKRDGEACRRFPLRGTNRCRLHGGASPQAQAKARERILGAADLAAQRLIEFMNDKRVPWPVRLSAARDLLDRAGLGAKNELTVELPQWQAVIDRIVVDAPNDLPALPSGPDVIDADELDMFEAWERPPRPDDDDEDEPYDEPTETTAVQLAPKVEYVDPATFSEKPPARLDPDGLTRRPAPRRRDA